MARNTGSETIHTYLDGPFHSRSTTCVVAVVHLGLDAFQCCWWSHLLMTRQDGGGVPQGLWNGGAKVPYLQKYKWAGEGESVCIDPDFFKAVSDDSFFVFISLY